MQVHQSEPHHLADDRDPGGAIVEAVQLVVDPPRGRIHTVELCFGLDAQEPGRARSGGKRDGRGSAEGGKKRGGRGSRSTPAAPRWEGGGGCSCEGPATGSPGTGCRPRRGPPAALLVSRTRAGSRRARWRRGG